jgi:hypothetical protein
MSEESSKIEKKGPFKGSCHCKAIQYEVMLELSDPPVASRCSCTVCVKSSFTARQIREEDLKFISPSSMEEIPDYQAENKSIHKRYCSKCGIHVVGHGVYTFNNQHVDFVSLNLSTLDQPQDGVDLSKFKIEYWDGLHNNWKAGKAEKPYSGGLV